MPADTAGVDVITAHGLTLVTFGTGTQADEIALAFGALAAGAVVNDARTVYQCSEECEGKPGRDASHQSFTVAFSISVPEPDAGGPGEVTVPLPECPPTAKTR